MNQGSIKTTVSSARALKPESARRTACAAWLLAFAVAAIPGAAIAASDTTSDVTVPLGEQAEKTMDNQGANTTAQGAMEAGKEGMDDSKATTHDAMKATGEGTDGAMSSGDDATKSNADDGMKNAMPTTGAAAATIAAPMAGGGEQFIASQGADEMLVDELDDADVVTGDDKNIGEIEDVLVGSDHRIRALVVEVGGFLGMGKKEVAVNFDRFEQSRNEDGKLRLRLQATVDELKAAPEFVPLKERKD